jgi:hypothetical protein
MSSLFWLNFPIVLINMGITCHNITNFVFNVHFPDIFNIMPTILVQHNIILKRNVKKTLKPKTWGVKFPTCLGILGILKTMLPNPFFLKK